MNAAIMAQSADDFKKVKDLNNGDVTKYAYLESYSSAELSPDQ